jgi:hypothetical protein
MLPLYHNGSTTRNQKHLIETMIGAAIWYFPQGKELWSGAISIEAIKAFHPNSGTSKPKLTADHEYPRKVAATELLHRDWSQETDPGKTMLQLYKSRYGRFNLVTPRENKLLVNHQRETVFRDPQTAYELAGIRLLAITSDQLALVKSRSQELIEMLLGEGHTK